ncbi:hypothetical protein MMPV_007260 [Pyropia vietnamensis]
MTCLPPPPIHGGPPAHVHVSAVPGAAASAAGAAAAAAAASTAAAGLSAASTGAALPAVWARATASGHGVGGGSGGNTDDGGAVSGGSGSSGSSGSSGGDGGGSGSGVGGGSGATTWATAARRPPNSTAAADAVAAGVAAAAAVSVQVALFGPLQTTIAFQYRTALATVPALRGLLAAGGVRRLYAGAPYGVAHAALSRGGTPPPTQQRSPWVVVADGDGSGPPLSVAATVAATAPASVVAATWRTALLPLEVARTNLQVRGAAGGGARLRASVAAAGLRALYAGGLASAASTGTGHLVFFSTLNTLAARVPAAPDATGEAGGLARWAGIGLAASAVADTANNGLRVITTAAQTRGAAAAEPPAYGPLVRGLLARSGGVWGLVRRGLPTRVAANGGQAIFFMVAWKGMEARVRSAMGLDGEGTMDG